MNELTPAQTRVLSFIRDFIEVNKMPPTVREICTHLHFKSPHAGTTHLRRLERKGYLELTTGISRGIRLTQPSEKGIPILGVAPAGIPLTEYANKQGTIDTAQMFQGPDLFAVRVKGDSMIGGGILNGDLVIIRSQPEVPDGAIALAYVDDEATIKRIHHTPTGLQLIPENPAYAPIDISDSTPSFRIAGRVIGVVRDMQ